MKKQIKSAPDPWWIVYQQGDGMRIHTTGAGQAPDGETAIKRYVEECTKRGRSPADEVWVMPVAGETFGR